MGAPLETAEHHRAIVLFDGAAASDARKVRLIGIRRVEVGDEIVPFEDLILVAVWTRDIRMLLRAVHESCA